MCLLIGPDVPQLKSRVESLQKASGYCIFVDIVGSSEMKKDNLLKWIAQIHNTFVNIRAFLSPSFPVLKSIGDELMFYIGDSLMASTGESALSLFAGMRSVANETDASFKAVKISLTYCNDAYAITFIPGVKDIYGIDIDLSARLLSKANPREIVMNESFHKKLMEQYRACGNKEQYPEVEKIEGPWNEKIKGFENYIKIYKLANQFELK